tara:strand:+ start:343 stop:600 length:258 start_codon:yes stop_codon:yes gene_type:complete
MAILFPIVYSIALIFLIWKAFKVMSTGWSAMDKNEGKTLNVRYPNKYTIHPELLDKAGNITDEELLTVRFSNDSDSTLEKGTTSE